MRLRRSRHTDGDHRDEDLETVATETESNEALLELEEGQMIDFLTETGLWFACESAGVSTGGHAHSSALFCSTDQGVQHVCTSFIFT